MSYTFDFENFEHEGKVYCGVVSYDIEWSSESTDSSGYLTSDNDNEDDFAVVESYSLDELFGVNADGIKGQFEIELSDPVFKTIEESISHLVDNHCDSLELEREGGNSDFNSDEESSSEE